MRLIDADALKESMNYNGGCGICFRYVDDADTVDAAPVKHGRWVFGFDSETGGRDLKAWTCSECNEKYPWQPNYCPHCGAKMDRERTKE